MKKSTPQSQSKTLSPIPASLQQQAEYASTTQPKGEAKSATLQTDRGENEGLQDISMAQDEDTAKLKKSSTTQDAAWAE